MIKLKIITKEFKRNIDYERYFSNKDVCFVDIETTGLSRNYNPIYLIGVLYYLKNKGMWAITQYFSDNNVGEGDVLNEFVKFVSSFDEIITYNGDSFDIPFINHRLIHNKISYEVSRDKCLDIYKIIKNNRYYLNLDNLKLKTIEKYLGIYREDIYTGKDCIDFYIDYTITNNNDSLEKILQHNYDDLFYMLDIIQIIDIIDDKRSFMLEYEDSNALLFIEELSTIGDQLIVKGNVEDDKKINLIHYDSNYKIEFNKDNKFSITLDFNVGLVTPTEKGLFIDKNKIGLSNNIIDSTIYNLSPNILLLKVEKDYCVENIKMLLNELLKKSLASF